MNNKQKAELANLWLKEGCSPFRLGDKCYDLHWQYNKSLSGQGCTACRKRRMRAKYSRLFLELIKGKDYDEIKK